ncbi:glyoxalase [Microbacteriaceae bacterium VKM Ac-2854]|nr:glyoxalase [Microbacteriaceae bacterium VKM Ac-2854]
MTLITSVTIEADDPTAAESFYATAFDLGPLVRVRAASAATSGFRGFTLSLLASQPANVIALTDAALAAGATSLKPAAKSLWGFGSSVQAPDGTIWTIASSSKKDTAPASREVQNVVLLIAPEDVAASRDFYVAHGLTVGKSFGRKYVEFDLPGSPIGFGLNPRRLLAKNAGVAPEGSGSHRLAITGAAFTDPDGFVWEA